MVDPSRYRGIHQFGKAYGVLFENDPHAPGSVDRVLMESMVRLCPETAGYLYGEYTPTASPYERGARPELERHAAEAIAAASDEGRVEDVARFASGLAARAGRDLDAIRVGGTEEEIIARGSDWCADVARVGCALLQVSGLAARLVYLVDTASAYRGHAIVEAFRGGGWGAVDVLTDVVYRRGGAPASAWDLMRDRGLVERHGRGDATPYTDPGQFRAAAIANYVVRRREACDYSVAGVNAYYRSILEMADRGWPGGIRWLHGEDG